MVAGEAAEEEGPDECDAGECWMAVCCRSPGVVAVLPPALLLHTSGEDITAECGVDESPSDKDDA